MKANVIEGCISCGLCASVCPEVFRMNDENVSEVYHQPTPEQEDATQEAADGCPVSVIEIESSPAEKKHLPAAPVSAQRADVFS